MARTIERLKAEQKEQILSKIGGGDLIKIRDNLLLDLCDNNELSRAKILTYLNGTSLTHEGISLTKSYSNQINRFSR